MQSEVLPCALCGEAIPASGRFCSFCGAPVVRRESKAPEGGGEHRQITVMFCDLVGSTALSNHLDAEDLRDVLRRYQQICADAIEARDGMIGQYLGDGVLAYFGYPKASESAAMHATDAALDIIRDVAASGDAFMRRHGVEFATRIALHTGRVLIGDMGAGTTHDRHAITGAVPNLAARLEQIAPRNGVVISAHTAAQVSGAFELESLGLHDLKGFADSVEAFQVMNRQLATAVIPERQQPLVGRERELERLRAAWQRVEQGGRERLSILAEPGMGKSALAAAFLASSGIAQDQIVEICGTLRDRNTPFACLRAAIERWTTLGHIRGGHPAQTQIARWFGVNDIAASPHAMTLHQVLQGETEDGKEGRASILTACRARIDAFPKPMLIVVEDLHWLDPSTAEMIDRFAIETDGVMVLGLSRPGLRNDPDTPGDGTIFLDPLDTGDCERLIATIAGCAVQPALVNLIADVSGGLPLFVEEFTKSLLESAAVREVRGVLRTGDLGTKVATPASILDLITVRLDALGKARSLAQICAVLGRTFNRADLGQ